MLGARILFVEDDPVNATAVGAWLRRNGALVAVAADPVAADGELARQEFDVLLSDVCLPGNDKLVWTERVARTHPALPIVLLTGRPELDSAIKAANLHVAAFIVKPPDFPELGQLLAHLNLTARRHRRAHASLRGLRVALADGATADPARLDSVLRDLEEVLLDLEAAPRVLSVSRAGHLRAALADAVRVIEETKHSFRSRELGNLRQRLLQTLAS
ncbi:MAG: hypothetical protein C0518_01665 [Opitutus sp.]|nr:hypothetical protein [Opitutus sp.]